MSTLTRQYIMQHNYLYLHENRESQNGWISKIDEENKNFTSLHESLKEASILVPIHICLF